MEVRFLSDLCVEGMEFTKGELYGLPDFIAIPFIHSGYAEEVEAPSVPKPPVKKPAKKKGKK